MAENRIKREQEVRETEVRKKAWTRPETLPSPDPEEGYSYRWIRLSTQGTSDPSNISSKLREGWEPVKASDHPEVMVVGSDIDDRFKDGIIIGGLMLCKAPIEMVQQRNEYFRTQTKSQMESVDNNLMRESDPRMPIFNDRKTKVTFGQGN